ncbi:response regulator transcription factor [Vagococcus elongatus]|uniref:DNA-binding response regulator n=1 Tax=Vagococcus elongatus TaxID=180344 RepID=A0A430B4I1_9ENTE|nr:response regulator transcription factor [Vagococcus elongatus]RSU15235.1 DNA-binding response regulator [Vagococcus elongatus]
MTILLVEDEESISKLVSVYLKNENYPVQVCHTGKDALEKIDQEGISLAILDVMLPDISGFELCQYIREKGFTYPIIMLTAKGEELDKITGLTLGADDYVTKPFKPLELVARVKAQLRRVHAYNLQAEPKLLTVKGLEVDIVKRTVILNGQPVNLTPKEYDILVLLLENRGQVVTTETLFQEVWQEKYFETSSNTVMVHIRHLREKLGDTSEQRAYIQTVWGVGYKID